MKFHKISRRLTAALIAGAMTVSMVGMTAFATSAPAEAPKKATITKEIKKNANVYAPATEFEFSIVPGTPVAGTATSDAILAGPEGGAAISGNIKSEPKASDINETKVEADKLEITLDQSKFTAPGIYRYVVKETAGSYKGVGYTTEEKYFDVYVDKDKNIMSYTFVSKDDPKKKDEGVFTNTYGVDGNGDDDGTINDLTVKKVVEGNQGDKSKKFSFTIQVDGDKGENYYVTFSKGTTPITLISGESQTITLADSESATIYGLSENDTYTVTEADYTSDGYKTTIGGTTTNTATGKITADTTITVTNTKNVTTPTGVAMTVAPYILMVALAGVFAFLFLRRRNRAEY